MRRKERAERELKQLKGDISAKEQVTGRDPHQPHSAAGTQRAVRGEDEAERDNLPAGADGEGAEGGRGQPGR